jgi:hypothetical protein
MCRPSEESCWLSPSSPSVPNREARLGVRMSHQITSAAAIRRLPITTMMKRATCRPKPPGSILAIPDSQGGLEGLAPAEALGRENPRSTEG